VAASCAEAFGSNVVERVSVGTTSTARAVSDGARATVTA
jgi:hypothetical protein